MTETPPPVTTWPTLADERIIYRDCPGHDGYRVGDDGSVWSSLQPTSAGTKRVAWRRMKLFVHKSAGHLYVKIRDTDGKQKAFYVHRLVLEAFVGPRPPGMGCRHFPDRDPANNRLDNLSWATQADNQKDKLVHGTAAFGETCSGARLTNDQASEIRSAWAAGNRSVKGLAEHYSVSRNTIWRVITNRTYIMEAS